MAAENRSLHMKPNFPTMVFFFPQKIIETSNFHATILMWASRFAIPLLLLQTIQSINIEKQLDLKTRKTPFNKKLMTPS